VLGGVLAWCLLGVSLSAVSAAPAARVNQRPADDRPQHDDAKLRDLGIHRYESRRLVLYSDIDPAIARGLPPLVDAVYPEWVKYFGELAPAADGSEFQLTGYLMKDRGLFLETGLLPEELVDFQHGKHRGYRFWMAEQSYDYYRRHLFLHEATHCYMMVEPNRDRPPLFYLEGVAELFGTHAIDQNGAVRFRVFPDDPNEEVGFGRVEMIQRAIANGEGLTIDEVWSLGDAAFSKSREEPYAWSWAACCFLDTHPAYRDRFRQLGPLSHGGDFNRTFRELFRSDLERLRCEWRLFVRSIEYGYDIERAAIDFAAGQLLAAGQTAEVTVQADRGWQCSGVAVAAGTEYGVSAAGEVVLATEPKPWVTHPDGVTIRYSGGLPLGRLTGVILPGDGQGSDPSPVIDLGSDGTFTADRDGVLYLRVNDAWSRLADNTGDYQVTVSRP
jgi:hypothetical protein